MTKKSFLRILSLLLAMLMVVSVVCACANNDKPDDPTDDPTEDPHNPTGDPEDIVYKANVPAGLDYGEEEFLVYAYPEDVFVWKDFDWQNNGLDGDRIGEAVYTRIEQVNEELNVDIQYFCGASYSDPTEFRTAVSTGDDAYDIANVTMLQHISMVQSGYLQEINSYGCLDLEAAWWDQNILPELSLSGMNFCLVGDIGTMYKRCIACIIFNKEIIAQNEGLDNPYDLVENKEWTVEAIVDMALDISQDLDGNEVYDDQDLYGMVYFSDVLCAMEIGCDVKWATKNDDDIPEMTLNDEKTIDVIDIASELLFDTTLSYNVTSNGQDEKTMWNMFMDNRALFYYGELHSAEDMRQMETDFGILPMPLYDEDQANYRHTVNPNVAAVLVIPMTNIEEEKTSYILDSLGAASKNILTPAYYDLNLQNVVSRDDESEVCLDIIISTLSYDMGYLYIADAGALIRDLCNAKATNFQSRYDTKASSFEQKIADLAEAVELHN